MTGSCICGAVTISIELKPDFILDCDCGLCRKVGAAWGYFDSSAVKVDGQTTTYVRSDKVTPTAEIHSCPVCSATTHFRNTEAFRRANPTVDQIGLNMRIFDPNELTGLEVRFANGRDWSGDGPFKFRRPPETISSSWRW